MVVVFRKVRATHGWLGNMAAFAIVHEGQKYHTAEALFQCLRFDKHVDGDICEIVRQPKSPMTAKMKAKSHRDKMVVEPMGKQEPDNMRLVLRLKIEQHPKLKNLLIDTGNELIIEDVTARPHGSGKFWGAALQEDGTWEGENWLGRLWSELRESLHQAQPEVS